MFLARQKTKTSPLFSLKGDRRNVDGYESVTKQAGVVALHQTLSRLWNLVQFVKSWHLVLDWNFKDCIEVQEKKKKVVVLRPRSPNYVKLGIFSRGVTAKKCTKSMMHVLRR